MMGAARISRTGTKSHPWIKYPDGYFTILCSCTGTANGRARNYAMASGLHLGATATCRGR